MLIKYKCCDKLGVLVEVRPEGGESDGQLYRIAALLNTAPKSVVSAHWREKGILITRIPDPSCRVRPRDAVQKVKRILAPSGLTFRCET